MSVARTRTVFLSALLLVTAGLAVGCHDDKAKAEADAKQTDSKQSDSKQKESQWYGTYKNTKESGTMVLQADHKGTLDMGGTKGDITWEIAGDDKAIIHFGIPMEVFRTKDGDLRDTEGTVWKKS
ncbi:MAG TPA: hypothetical protein VLJ39_13525 [Tepidisphaeraceae bacterium]|jgi:hypothetical protein|nr:hypothetical protein [Tepidisphaeraceae bacterium]